MPERQLLPDVLSESHSLFGETSDKKPLKLAESRTVGDGVAILTFQTVDQEPK
jgi:hypothetical protein